MQRYLTDEAVAACPPSAGYRLRKYARRNRRALATVTVIAVALVGATAVSSWQAVDANAARKLADDRLAKEKEARRLADEHLDNEKKAREEAATEAAVARAVNDFLQNDLLRQVNRWPQVDGAFGAPPNLTVKEALDRAAARIDGRFQGQPLVEAAIQTAIGEAYESLTQQKLAVPHLERAVALRRASLGADHPDTLATLERLAGCYGMAGRSRDAVILLEDVVCKHERLYGSDHPTTLDALSRLTTACQQAGMWERAIMLAKQVLERRTKTLGTSHDATVGAMQMLSSCYLGAGSFGESIAWYEKAVKAAGDPDILPMNPYARALQGAGRLDAADCQLRKALEVARRQSDRRARAMGILAAQKVLGLNLLLQGRYVEAEAVAREALAIMDVELPDDWSRFHTMSLVGGALLGQQRYTEAEPFLVQGYQGMKQRETMINAAFKHWLTKAGDRLARFYEVTNQPEQARSLREEMGSSSGS